MDEVIRVAIFNKENRLFKLCSVFSKNQLTMIKKMYKNYIVKVVSEDEYHRLSKNNYKIMCRKLDEFLGGA